MMPLAFAHALALACEVYLGLGCVLLPWWHWQGLRRIDAQAAGSTWTVRAILSPGLVLLWPLLLPRALRMRNGHPPSEMNNHRAAAMEETP